MQSLDAARVLLSGISSSFRSYVRHGARYQRTAEDVAADVYPKRNQRGKRTYVQEKSDVDWATAYEQLLKTNAKLRDKVESGGTTKEEVIEWMRKRHTSVKKTDVRSGKSPEEKVKPPFQRQVKKGGTRGVKGDGMEK